MQTLCRLLLSITAGQCGVVPLTLWEMPSDPLVMLKSPLAIMLPLMTTAEWEESGQLRTARLDGSTQKDPVSAAGRPH